MFDKPPFFSSSRSPIRSLLEQEFVWNSCLTPWFYVSVGILDQGRVSDRAVMVQTFDAVKKLLKQRSDCFTVTSIHYITPGHMNGSGDWKMERLLEISELFNEGGWSIPRCKVGENRVYRAMRLEPASEWGNEQLVFRSGDALTSASQPSRDSGSPGTIASKSKKKA